MSKDLTENVPDHFDPEEESDAERDERLIHEEALKRFNEVWEAVHDDRMQCREDRRFCFVAGAQWEGNLAKQFKERARLEVNKVHISVNRQYNEYRNNRISVDFIPRDGTPDKDAELADGLHRADEKDSVAEEAYDNAFEEGVAGGYGAWRLSVIREDRYAAGGPRRKRGKLRISIDPIFDADSSVFFDLGSKRYDKADARYCFVVTSMTPDDYRAKYDDEPTTWGEQYDLLDSNFEWYQPDVVHVAEYYRVVGKEEKVHTFRHADGTEEEIEGRDLDDDARQQLEAIGAVEVLEKRETFEDQCCEKYILSGGKILIDDGEVTGGQIPIVPFYAKRIFVNNRERAIGHTRLAKDAQRLKNMQLSKLAEIAALSSVEKPIVDPEQVAGVQHWWANDSVENYAYLPLKKITGPDGTKQARGPLEYTRSSNIPPAMAALLQITEQDMKDVLGADQEADKMLSGVSGKAVELIQQRLDNQSFIYMSNLGKSMRRSGQIWLGMAREIYVEEGRQMHAVDENGKRSLKTLAQPTMAENGQIIHENDLESASFDVDVSVGPSSESKRAAVVRALTGMMTLTQDPDTLQVLSAAALMNLDGEGIEDIREYFRKQLVRRRVVQPTEDDKREMAAEAQAAEQGKQQDPTALFTMAAAKEASAKADKASAEVYETAADIQKKRAEAEQIRAETVKTLLEAMGLGEIPEALRQRAQLQPVPGPRGVQPS